MIEIISKIVKTDVTCVKCYQKLILAGIGGNLHLYTQAGKLLQIYNIFDGHKIHGIVPNLTNYIAIFGANHLKIIEFDFIKSCIIKDINYKRCEDWIFSVRWLDSDTQIGTLFAQNYISLWNVSGLKLIENVSCKEKCTLYSATLVNDTWNSLFAFCGTVFGHILIWKPSKAAYISPVLWRLTGHDGAIFSIVYDSKQNKIVSTSDDRTVRIWEINTDIFSDSLDKESAKITLKHSMYGHIARVFRSKIVNDLIITGGEDSFVHVWNFQGKLVRKFETHQSGCIWALDETEDIIVTGGGDCGISLYPLKLNKDIKILPSAEEVPKSLKITAAGNIVLMTDIGLLKYYKNCDKIWMDIHVHDDLKSYAILEVSKNKKLISLAGLHGSIHIYKEQENNLVNLYSLNKNDGTRIFSLHWLTDSSFLTCTTEGQMSLWHFNNNGDTYTLESDKNYILPVCKERWATSAVLCFENMLAVGDRKGNIHLYETDNKECVQTIKKAHCHLGVTALHYFNNQLVSLGRNALLNKYDLDKTTKSLFQLSTDKLPFSWLCSIVQLQHIQLLLGYSGANFIIFNLENRRIILDINCGGGHRSWDVEIIPNGRLNFIFIKDKKLNQFTESWKNILTFDIISGYHTKEINAGDVINFKNNDWLFISGGEDTTIRFSLVTPVSFRTVYTVKSHLSSVRCIKIYPLENNEYLLFSGGGRAQIILQKLRVSFENDKFNFVCHQLDSYYKTLDENEAETRIMDFVVIQLEEMILLIAGCSDGTLKCYTINKTDYKLVLINSFIHAVKCIIKLGYVNICNRNIVVSMATDGILSFWDLTEFCQNLNNTTTEIQPFYLLQAHQSGINSFHSKSLSNNTFIFATGGDDNKINLNILKFEYTDTFIIEEITKWNSSKFHWAQITGIFLVSNYLITASTDQLLNVFQFELKDDSLKCEFLKQYKSAVSDIQGMRCIVNSNGIFTCVYGKGIDICLLNNLI